MKKNISNFILGTFLLVITASFMISCEENELSDLLEEDTAAGSTGTSTYQNTAKAILDNACVECHNATTASGGIRLDNYTNASAVAESGLMVNRMTSILNPMPPSGNLPDSIIQGILDWVEDGILEN